MKLTWKTFKFLIIIGSLPPFYFHLRSVFQEDYVKLATLNDFLFWLGMSICATITLSVIVFKEIEWLQKLFPWRKTVIKRIAAELFLTFSTVIAGMLLLSKFTFPMHRALMQIEMTYRAHLFTELTTGMVLWAILISVTEGVYFFNEWKNGLVLSETLQREKVQSQLEALRNQANPHFLFNSLNVLSSLVHSDPDKAEEFINQFASVYRYVLNIQDKNVVTLREELDFLKSYMFLQKIRFKEGLNFKIDIDEKIMEHFIVPFSLQMLVENAIKHNIVDKENPLSVNVFIDDFRVYVKNNIQSRDSQELSTGMGLNNLRQRYFHLAGIMPEIEEKNDEFIVCMPLFKPGKKDENENIDKYERCYHRRRKRRCRKA